MEGGGLARKEEGKEGTTYAIVGNDESSNTRMLYFEKQQMNRNLQIQLSMMKTNMLSNFCFSDLVKAKWQYKRGG